MLITSAGLCIRDWKKYAGQHLYLERADAVYFFFFFLKSKAKLLLKLTYPKNNIRISGKCQAKKDFFYPFLSKIYAYRDMTKKQKHLYENYIWH